MFLGPWDLCKVVGSYIDDLCFQARRAAADAAAGAAETIARVRLEATANISESADRLVKVLQLVNCLVTSSFWNCFW